MKKASCPGRHNLPGSAISTTLTVAALTTAALSGIGAAYTGFPPLLCPVQIKYNPPHNTQQNQNDNKILHADLHRTILNTKQPEHIPLSTAYPFSSQASPAQPQRLP